MLGSVWEHRGGAPIPSWRDQKELPRGDDPSAGSSVSQRHPAKRGRRTGTDQAERMISTKAGLLSLRTTGMWGQIILSCRGGGLHYTMFNSNLFLR